MLANNKRGLSPLIATVLLVGFSVAIVALVIVWGTNYVKEVQEKEGGIAEGKLNCATDVEINILNVEKIADGQLDISVANVKNTVDGFVFRVNGNKGTDIVAVNTKIESAGTQTIQLNYDASATGDITSGSIEAIPRIRIGKGAYEACSNQLVKFKLNG